MSDKCIHTDGRGRCLHDALPLSNYCLWHRPTTGNLPKRSPGPSFSEKKASKKKASKKKASKKKASKKKASKKKASKKMKEK